MSKLKLVYTPGVYTEFVSTLSVHLWYNINMRKVFKNGNSLAVTVPKAYAHDLSLTTGSNVDWKKTEEGLLLVSQNRAKKAAQIDPEVAKLIKKISKKYTQVWQDLSKV